MSAKTVGVFHLPFFNKGEEVVYRGGEALLNSVFPDATLLPISGYPAWSADRRERRNVVDSIKRKYNLPTSYTKHTSTKFHDIYREAELDLLCVVGCTLFDTQLELYRHLFDKCESEKIPILFLGTGSNKYDNDTTRYVTKFLQKYPVEGLITRDSVAFDAYQRYVPFSHDGIDCGFFIDDWFSPPDMNMGEVVYTFDKGPRPDYLEIGPDTVIVSHRPYDNPFLGTGKRILEKILRRGIAFPTPNLDSDKLLISDDIRDYLTLYKSAKVTHSDRMHACVPALAYDGKAHLYMESDRAFLFDGFVKGDIREGATIDRESVETAKQKQEDALREFKGIVF